MLVTWARLNVRTCCELHNTLAHLERHGRLSLKHLLIPLGERHIEDEDHLLRVAHQLQVQRSIMVEKVFAINVQVAFVLLVCLRNVSCVHYARTPA